MNKAADASDYSQSEINLQLELNKKSEQQALAKYGPNQLIDEMLSALQQREGDLAGKADRRRRGRDGAGAGRLRVDRRARADR